MRHQCPHCSSNYSRRDHLKEHLRKKHDVDEVTKKKYFGCPFTCGVPSFRTMIELLKHCESAHDQSLFIYRQYITYATVIHHQGIITGKKEVNLTAGQNLTPVEGTRRGNYLYYLCEARQNLPPSKQQ